MACRAVAIQTSSPLTAFPPPEGLRRPQARAHTDRASSPTHFKASPVSLSSAELVLALTLALQALHATFPPFEGLASSSCALPGQEGTIFPRGLQQTKQACRTTRHAWPSQASPAYLVVPASPVPGFNSLQQGVPACPAVEQGSIPCVRVPVCSPFSVQWTWVQFPVSGSPFATQRIRVQFPVTE